jgi:predicted dehydrogenase
MCAAITSRFEDGMTAADADLRIAIIGAGFIGRCHARAVHDVATVFGPYRRSPRLAVVADLDEVRARELASRFPGCAAACRWEDVIEDAAIDGVVIALPNHLHHPVAKAALAAGKAVLLEKPMAVHAWQARELAALAAGRTTLVGYNFLHSPAVAHCIRMMREGALGEFVHFAGAHVEDYMADPTAAAGWRGNAALAGFGALADLGAHIVSIALALGGPINEVCGLLATIHPDRPEGADGTRVAIRTDDCAHALVRFRNGRHGMLQVSRVAHGRKMALRFELTGTGGTVCVDHERQNELLVYRPGDSGFATVPVGPAHPSYGRFLPAAGHGLGFVDTLVIQMNAWISGILGGARPEPGFAQALKIEAVLDAIARSARERTWVAVDPAFAGATRELADAAG